jgi:imidazole glycerol-phosphate synthase subunit HisH
MTAPRARVLDLGMGNLRSVAKALEAAGASVTVAPEPDPDAALLVVPGQGHFDACATAIAPVQDEVRAWIDDGKAFLGICLGLQVLFESSDESPAPGLGVFPGRVARFPSDVRAPQIGWNTVEPTGETRLFAGIEPGTRFYFVHSYAAPEGDFAAATTTYGVTYTSAIERDALTATQFHPEKSGDAGIRLLRNVVGAL